MKKANRKDLAHAVIFVVLAAVLIHCASIIMRPVHNSYGSTWDAYLCEPKDSIDVLFLGSSYAYCDWNPEIMYAASGLTGYVMAGSEQTPSITYWYLKQALKTQSPQVVVMEGSSFFFEMYQNYTQINLDYMPRGIDRARAILDAAEPDKRLGLFFDLYFYHDRWKELTREDIAKLITPASADVNKGYTYVDNVYDTKGSTPYHREPSKDTEAYAKHLEAFEKIAELCRDKGIDLIVTINPTFSQCSQEIYDKLERDLTGIAPEADFMLLANSFDEIGLDISRDLYDGGHLNFYGACKFSEWTGKMLLGKGYSPREQTKENAAAWDDGAQYWLNLRDNAQSAAS